MHDLWPPLKRRRAVQCLDAPLGSNVRRSISSSDDYVARQLPSDCTDYNSALRSREAPHVKEENYSNSLACEKEVVHVKEEEESGDLPEVRAHEAGLERSFIKEELTKTEDEEKRPEEDEKPEGDATRRQDWEYPSGGPASAHSATAPAAGGESWEAVAAMNSVGDPNAWETLPLLLKEAEVKPEDRQQPVPFLRDLMTTAESNEECMTLQQIVELFQTEARHCSQMPLFQLVLEPKVAHVKRRSAVVADMQSPSAISMQTFYPCVSHGARQMVVHRVDRDVSLLDEASEAIRAYFRMEGAASGPLSVTIHGFRYDLGPASMPEPLFPLRVEVVGRPIVINGPPVPLSPRDIELNLSADWVARNLNLTEVPTGEAILFGLKNVSAANDHVPYVSKPELKRALKAAKGGGLNIEEGQNDCLILQPPINPAKWTVDCWIKFPLRGFGLDRVLLAPFEASTGTHILFRDAAYVGCEVPASRAKEEDRLQRRAVPWLTHTVFLPACKRDDDTGRRLVKNLKHVVGWHRLTVACDGKRQLFYLDGSSIGGTASTPAVPMARIGGWVVPSAAGLRPGGWCLYLAVLRLNFELSRAPGNRMPSNCAVGAIARLKIFRTALSSADVARLCGVKEELLVTVDDERDPTWEWRNADEDESNVDEPSYDRRRRRRSRRWE